MRSYKWLANIFLSHTSKLSVCFDLCWSVFFVFCYLIRLPVIASEMMTFKPQVEVLATQHDDKSGSCIRMYECNRMFTVMSAVFTRHVKRRISQTHTIIYPLMFVITSVSKQFVAFTLGDMALNLFLHLRRLSRCKGSRPPTSLLHLSCIIKG